MDVMLQRHCARYIYVVPDGLRELMNDISREVLRSQPEDMYTFIADYLDALLITRENARVAARFVQYMSETSETIVDLLARTGISREEANRTATIIQEAFKAWTMRKGILKEDEESVVAKIIEEAGLSEVQVQSAATVIQNAFKTYKLRQQREAQLLSGIIDWRVAARSAIKLYRRSGVTPEEAKRAANLIKAAYKGYYTRRAIRLLNELPVDEGTEEGDSVEFDSAASSLYGESRKSKGVRIDFASVVPHVDFGDDELVSRDLTASMLEETGVLPPNVDVMTRIFGDYSKFKTDEEFIRDILRDLLASITGQEDQSDLPIIMDDRDSETDDFVPAPVEESEEPLYNKPMSVPTMSQEQLDVELEETKREMIELTGGSLSNLSNRHSGVEEAVTTQRLMTQRSSKLQAQGSMKRSQDGV